ncbi:MAG: glycoside hydrolase family 16 protein [Ornithinimicrobium sp.]
MRYAIGGSLAVFGLSLAALGVVPLSAQLDGEGDGSRAGTQRVDDATTTRTAEEASVPGWGTPQWRDEFDGNSVDESNWRVRDADTDGNQHYDWAVLDRDAVCVRDGLLRIRLEELAEPVQDMGHTRYWSTGFLESKGLREAQYGRWEFRAKIPTERGSSQGVWPAFWLTNDSLGEIDIMEAWGDPTKRFRPAQFIETSRFTVHESTEGDRRSEGWWYEPITMPGADSYMSADDFHVWTVEYTPDSLKAYMDGELAVHLVEDEELVSGQEGDYSWLWGETFTSSPWDINVNLQMGDPYWTPAPEPSADTELPADYLVDYVRFWSFDG